MVRDGRHRAVWARTVAAVRSAEVAARRAGTRLRTVPVSPPGTRLGVVPVSRPLMACAGVPRGTRAAVLRRRVRLTAPAERRAPPLGTDRGETAAPPRAATPAAHAPRPAVTIGAAGPRLAVSIAADPGPQTKADIVLPAVRPAKAPVVGLHPVAGLADRPRAAFGATLRRVATSVAPEGQLAPGRGAPPRATPGEARGPRAKGRPRAMAAVTRHRDQPAAGRATAAPATAGLATAAQVRAGHARAAQATGTGHARARLRIAVTARPMWPGLMFLIRSAPSSSTRKRGLS